MPTLIGHAEGSAYDATRVQPYASTAGNALIVAVVHQAGALTSVTDSAGNAYIKAGDAFDSGATAQARAGIYYCLDALAVTSVTATQGVTSALLVQVQEWSGITSLRGAHVAVNDSSIDGVETIAAQSGDVVVSATGYSANGVADGDFATVVAPFTQVGRSSVSDTIGVAASTVATTTGTYGPAYAFDPKPWRRGTVLASFAPAAPEEPEPSVHVFDGTDWLDGGVYVHDGSGWVAATPASPV